MTSAEKPVLYWEGLVVLLSLMAGAHMNHIGGKPEVPSAKSADTCQIAVIRSEGSRKE
jgi:hypothetical protein